MKTNYLLNHKFQQEFNILNVKMDMILKFIKELKEEGEDNENKGNFGKVV